MYAFRVVAVGLMLSNVLPVWRGVHVEKTELIVFLADSCFKKIEWREGLKADSHFPKNARLSAGVSIAIVSRPYIFALSDFRASHRQ